MARLDSKKLASYVWHSGTGTLIAVSECSLIFLTRKEANEVGDGALLPVDVNEYPLKEQVPNSRGVQA